MFELLHESPIEFEGDRADNYSEGCEELLSTRFQSWIQRWYQRISSVMIMSIKRVKDEKAIIMKSELQHCFTCWQRLFRRWWIVKLISSSIQAHNFGLHQVKDYSFALLSG